MIGSVAILLDAMVSAALSFFHRVSPLVLAGLLFVLSFASFVWRLGEGPIYRTMEGREALVTQEIVRSGNFILPLRNGETIPSKPPLLHWFGAAVSMLSGGVSMWSVRFPNAFFSALSVALTCLLGCRLSGQRAEQRHRCGDRRVDQPRPVHQRPVGRQVAVLMRVEPALAGHKIAYLLEAHAVIGIETAQVAERLEAAKFADQEERDTNKRKRPEEAVPA